MSDDRDGIEEFCASIWDSLFEAIGRSPSLTVSEKRVLEHLWAESSVRTCSCNEYPGDAAFARVVRMSERRLRAALNSLERKGFIRAFGASKQQPTTGYLLNALVLESAYESAKRAS